MRQVNLLAIDLHTHTTASDGSYTPKELILLASQNGIKKIAITDHDTVAAIDEAIKIGLKHNIEVIPGIEISVNYPGVPGSIHLLGFFIDYTNPIIENYIQTLKEYRRERNIKMFAKLSQLGFNITQDDFPDIPLTKLGRAHIAKKMFEKGYVKTINEAFENFLKKGEKAYVNKQRLSIEKGIELIHALHGVACLAHPYTLKLNNQQLELFVKYLKDSCSLDALEVFYPEHSQRFIEFYLELATKYRLIATGGSDFHGENKPDLKLGDYIPDSFNKPFLSMEEVVVALKNKSKIYEHKVA